MNKGPNMDASGGRCREPSVRVPLSLLGSYHRRVLTERRGSKLLIWTG